MSPKNNDSKSGEAEEGGESEGGVSLPSKEELKNLSEEERKKRADQASKAASSVQGIIDSLKSKAAVLSDPDEREKTFADIYDREIEKRGLTKKARILESGTFQGAVGGAGYGLATGAGLGATVGTLVGGVASIPTTAVGGLVGAGAGAIRGPWIKLKRRQDDGSEKEEKVQVPQEDVDSGAIQLDDKTGEVTSADPGVLERAVDANKGAPFDSEQERKKVEASEKRKPPKLEVRSNKQGDEKSSIDAESQPKKKPPKLEVRSGKTE